MTNSLNKKQEIKYGCSIDGGEFILFKTKEEAINHGISFTESTLSPQNIEIQIAKFVEEEVRIDAKEFLDLISDKIFEKVAETDCLYYNQATENDVKNLDRELEKVFTCWKAETGLNKKFFVFADDSIQYVVYSSELESWVITI